MKTMSKSAGETKRGFKKIVAGAASRYLIREAERSTKVCPLPLIYEPQYPIELLKESKRGK